MPHDEIPERRPLRGVSRQFFNGGKGIEAPFAHHVRYGLPHGVLQHVILRVLPSQGNMPVLFYIGGKGFADVLRVPARYEGHGAEDAGNRRSAGAYTEHLADERLKPGVVLLHVVELRVDAGLIEVRGVERALFGPDGIFEIQLRNLLFNAHRDNRAAELFPDGGKFGPLLRRKSVHVRGGGCLPPSTATTALNHAF